MRSLLHTLTSLLSMPAVEREIAPGVRVRVRPVSDSFHLTDGPSLRDLGVFLRNSWDLARGRARIVPFDIEQRLK